MREQDGEETLGTAEEYHDVYLTWRAEVSVKNLIALIYKKDFATKEWDLLFMPQKTKLPSINESYRRQILNCHKRNS